MPLSGRPCGTMKLAVHRGYGSVPYGLPCGTTEAVATATGQYNHDGIRRMSLIRVCACCDSTHQVERHHLYSVKDGCPDDLQIWLCRVCHERVRGMQTGGPNHNRRLREGMARAKAAGKHIGRRHTLEPEQRIEAARLHQDGMSLSAIAARFGCGRTVAHRAVVAHRPPA
jgi:hypothetical protein